MRQVVVDASVVVKWFKPEAETDSSAAAVLRQEFESGELVLAAPSFLALELLNALGRRWRWPGDDLRSVAIAFGDLGLDLHEPELTTVAEWIERGLTAYDAAYVALAEQLGTALVTADERILATAPQVAVHVTSF